MRLSIARLLVLAVALVLPLQGMTAVAAAMCMTLTHHQDDVGHEEQATQEGDHADHAAHSHADSGAGDEKTVHCGPCTACCASASIAGPVPTLMVSPPSHAAYVFSEHPPLGVQPSGLYRPPLSL